MKFGWQAKRSAPAAAVAKAPPLVQAFSSARAPGGAAAVGPAAEARADATGSPPPPRPAPSVAFLAAMGRVVAKAGESAAVAPKRQKEDQSKTHTSVFGADTCAAAEAASAEEEAAKIVAAAARSLTPAARREAAVALKAEGEGAAGRGDLDGALVAFDRGLLALRGGALHVNVASVAASEVARGGEITGVTGRDFKQ